MDSFRSVKTSFSLAGPLDSKLIARLEKIQAPFHSLTFTFTNTDLMKRIAAWILLRLTCMTGQATVIRLKDLTWKILACTSDRIQCSQCKATSVKKREKDPYMKARSKSFSWRISLKIPMNALSNLEARSGGHVRVRTPLRLWCHHSTIEARILYSMT